MVLDILDVWIPAANLGLVNLSDGVTGLLGYAFTIMYTDLFLTGINPQIDNFSDVPQSSMDRGHWREMMMTIQCTITRMYLV
jgi:hypothetical protein